MNSYEVGLSTSLMFPRVVFPRFGDKEYDFPATTTFKLYIDQLNRAKYYKLLAFGGNATYDFQPKRNEQSIVLHRSNSRSTYFATLRKPLRSCRRRILHSTSACATSLFRSLSICTPTTTHLCRVRNPIWWQTTVSSAGNLTSCIYRIFGKSFSEKDKSCWVFLLHSS